MYSLSFAQEGRRLQYDRPPGKDGINVFETPKNDTIEYTGMAVRVGGDFSIIFQGLDHSNDNAALELVDLSNNFALPTANLNLDVQMADGVRMHLRTYLSSRHHAEAWVKGGYFQMDNLNFIKEGFMSGLMEYTTLRFGMDEINYGDAHFRRSDNARAIYNPFVGNYIMDAFTTEPFGEITVQSNGLLAVLGISNGRLNQAPLTGDDGFAFYSKLGYDNLAEDGLRFRLTGSLYTSSERSTRDYLYNGDRAGARYYNVLEVVDEARPSDFLPRFNTGYAHQTAIQFNPFIKYDGLEFFGILEFVNNGDDEVGGGVTHFGAEALYRFGTDEKLYFGARYNSVGGEVVDGAPEININRFNIGGGWFITDNTVMKLEYVTSTYDGDGWVGTKFEGAEFSGINLEAAISF